MKIWSKVVRVVEGVLLSLGLLLLIAFSLAHLHRFVMFRADMTQFKTEQLDSANEGYKAEVLSRENAVATVSRPANVDQSLGSAQRTRVHHASLRKSAEAVAVLRIPRLQLEAPVLEGTDQFTLNRGVGRIAGTAQPGQSGNIGIAGHRDGFFRPLKDISAGDSIELVTQSGTVVYLVDRVRITSPADVSVLQPRTKPSLTLVTCYPFYFVGPAPKRYVVQASLKQ
ncbi:MAG TPA: class D sortase [Candidatus Sulfotelmatobacter sp.]|nr:class D sortase [Candidatus Sulfotelmatobacter sp.]